MLQAAFISPRRCLCPIPLDTSQGPLQKFACKTRRPPPDTGTPRSQAIQGALPYLELQGQAPRSGESLTELDGKLILSLEEQYIPPWSARIRK